MIPQQPHRLPHQPPDLARHIDCGLYAWISALLILNGHPLSILTPSVVHRLRVYMAHFLLQNPITFDVNTILGQVRHQRPTATTIIGNSLCTMTVTQMNTGHAQQHPDPTPANNRVASLRPRQKPSVTVPTPLPARQRHSIILADPAISSTYVAESTVTGAGKGLFAARYFNGNDEDSAYIGEYFGGHHTGHRLPFRLCHTERRHHQGCMGPQVQTYSMCHWIRQ